MQEALRAGTEVNRRSASGRCVAYLLLVASVEALVLVDLELRPAARG